ncbi:host nuclease inhibitor protein [Salinicola sp. RZ23]|uniref:host nuclease inhibitor protein n=1 Tax=Salinicola sp. RZ23 TaxID=1949087 RepID=UPI000DA23E31|nr:host nuclease inhibitor protein [Salinicola sp. RZ23]
MRTRYRAYCYASGEIHIGTTTPTGAVELATGPHRALTEEVDVLARHGYRGERFVPGVPETFSLAEKRDAVARFVDWVRGGSRAAIWRTGEQVRADIDALQEIEA